MSHVIQCDVCKRYMYADSRSDKGTYFYISVDLSSYSCHLCRDCFKKRLGDIFGEMLGEFDEEDEQ